MDVLLAAIVSVVVRLIKGWAHSTQWVSVAIAIVVSFLAAGAYAYLSDSHLWPIVLRVFTIASAIYAVLIAQVFPTKSSGGA